ncbi:MAG: flippase-like domain-containing protein [Prevotellaceae bacterium]|jgi:uncharacterized protein (TIRG00374 family)|nr:flippase-like domain-containing protein [Prevotellaceae bacterium]
MGKSKLSTLLKIAFFLLLTAALLWFSFKDAHASELLLRLKSARYGWVALGVALGVAAYVVRALRWRLLLEPMGYKPRLGQMYNAVIIGYAANLLFPRLGEVARCGTLTKSNGIPMNKLIGTVLAERVFDTLCLIAIVLAAVLLRINTFGKFLHEHVWLNLTSSEGGLGSFGIALLALAALAAAAAAGAWTLRRRLRSNPLAQKIWGFFRGIKEGLKTFATMQRRGDFLLHSLLLWGCYWGMAWVVLLAIPATAGINPIDGLVVMLLGSFGIVAPTNGGLGAYHAITSIGLAAIYGIPENDGLAYATLSHESQMLFIILLGLVAYVRVFLLQKKRKVATAAAPLS